LENLQEQIKNFILSLGAVDVGFAKVEDGDFGSLKYAVSVVVKLSDSVVEEVDLAPTHTYFNHYRTVNAFIDRVLLEAGMFLERSGYKYIPVAASQTINSEGWHYSGRYSHKKTACLAGLGTIGKNSLFLHNRYGSRVRLGTLFTDCPFETPDPILFSPCAECDLCVRACPAGAIKGIEWSPEVDREKMFSPEKCSQYMKTAFKDIGRGAVCGVCMSVCPYSKGKTILDIKTSDSHNGRPE